MIERIEINYEPGYFSSFINLENIDLVITRDSVSYKENFFDDEIDEVYNHKSSWTKEISAEEFKHLSGLIDSVMDIKNSYEYYDSEVTYITTINTDCTHHKVEIYCNLNKNEALVPLVKELEKILGKEYLLPSMQYVEE